jgi:hypothetical protein
VTDFLPRESSEANNQPMSGLHRFRLNRSGVMLALISAAFAGEAGAAAGRTEFTIGGVTLARGGVEQPLARGTELDNGDVVRTNGGRAQIRFTDGSYVSLQPNTEFGIREYRYENRTDGSERGFFGLLKGAMRTVTGAIGRVNRDRYQIATPTATVGIRGTGGVIQVQDDGSTLIIGTSGIWSLTNPAGSVDVPAGTSALAPTDPNQPPQESTEAPTSGPAPVQEQEPEFVAGEERNEEGELVLPQPPLGPLGPLVTGSGYATALAYGFFSSPNVDFDFPVDAVFDGSGQMTSLVGQNLFGEFNIGTGSHADFGTDGILAWGRWTGDVFVGVDGSLAQTYSANQGMHYVIGIPTAMMPTTGTGTYALMGATRPTYLNDIGVAPGTFSGSLNVDFARLTVGMDLRVTMSDSIYTIGGNASISGGPFFAGFQQSGQGTLSVASPSGGCVSGCNALVTGFFAGTNADRAGLGYHINDFLANKDILGAAAFQKQ